MSALLGEPLGPTARLFGEDLIIRAQIERHMAGRPGSSDGPLGVAPACHRTGRRLVRWAMLDRHLRPASAQRATL
ncbi:hypothetical protein [Streptomyces sp. SudanB5_2050]|uniref:hypothetical protein n=1 Tax=Streptomyces sp. SudanB5_2050 TaxID=3035274 RepID=UPI0036D82601